MMMTATAQTTTVAEATVSMRCDSGDDGVCINYHFTFVERY